MTSTKMNFQGYEVIVESVEIDAETRSYTIAFEGEIISSGVADAESHEEVVEYFDIAPITKAIYERQESNSDGGAYYRQVCSDYYYDRI